MIIKGYEIKDVSPIVLDPENYAPKRKITVEVEVEWFAQIDGHPSDEDESGEPLLETLRDINNILMSKRAGS